MWFTRISIGNPVLATMMMMALLVIGLFSYQRLKVDQFPDIAFPVVVVRSSRSQGSGRRWGALSFQSLHSASW